MKNINKTNDSIMYTLAILQNRENVNARCLLEDDLAKLIFENIKMDGEQGNYKLTYHFNKEDLNVVLEWFKDKFNIDYHELLDINTALEKFTEKYNENFRDFACEVLQTKLSTSFLMQTLITTTTKMMKMTNTTIQTNVLIKHLKIKDI